MRVHQGNCCKMITMVTDIKTTYQKQVLHWSQTTRLALSTGARMTTGQFGPGQKRSSGWLWNETYSSQFHKNKSEGIYTLHLL